MSKPRAAQAHAADGDSRQRKRFPMPALRKVAAAVTALVLGAGLAVVGVAAPASAHHNTIKATAVCSTDGKTADVTWSVENSEKITEKITWSSDESVVPKGTTLDSRETKTFVQKSVKLGTTVTLKLDAKWENNQKASNEGKFTVGSAVCDDDSGQKKIEFCHSGNGKKYELIETAVDAFYTSGHIKHDDDIWPAFSFWKHGELIEVPAQGDQSRLLTGDCSKPEQISVEGAPAFNDRCGPDNEVLTVPKDTKKIDWNSSESSGVITVTATAKQGYVFKPGQQTVWTFTIDDKPCPPTEIPVGGKPSYTDTCGPDNEKLVVPKSTDRVTWKSVEVDGRHVVTATAAEGYAFPVGAKTEWVFPIDDSDCVIPVIGAPTFQDTCGADNEKLTVPTDSATIDWEHVEVDGVITVTAKPLGHNVFPADAQTVWKFEIDDKPCVIEVVGAPTFDDTCGPQNEDLFVPEDTDAIDWESVREGDLITVTATAKGGSVFPEGAQAKWTFTVDDKPCLIELNGEPTFSDVCGPDNEEFSYPEDTALITWSHAEVDGEFVVTAKAAEGNTFPQGPIAIWSYPLDDEPCVAPTLDGSVATGICEADAPWISYKVTLTDPDAQVAPDHRTVWLELSDGEHVEKIELGKLNEEGVLDGRTLWPGASVDAEGNATGWPGWKQLDNGTWVQTDDNFAWTRDLTSARFIVNPEFDVVLAYPPATPDCIAAPTVTPGGDGATPSTPAGTGLASTGFAGTTIAIVAGVIVIAGIAFLVIARLRRKQS
ncbi:hypothetical protein ACFVTX_12970 [Agromyces sp. NPDC058136]|uniref:hypothetical protein n=1 Tax=Agromyces sp. NPDC058136 TaxID=3346354 RepID=UPI0036DF85B0